MRVLRRTFLRGRRLSAPFSSSATAALPSTASESANLLEQGRAFARRCPLATPLGDYEFWFSTAANRARFAADPWKFAPKYGGF